MPEGTVPIDILGHDALDALVWPFMVRAPSRARNYPLPYRVLSLREMAFHSTTGRDGGGGQLLDSCVALIRRGA